MGFFYQFYKIDVVDVYFKYGCIWFESFMILRGILCIYEDKTNVHALNYCDIEWLKLSFETIKII